MTYNDEGSTPPLTTCPEDCRVKGEWMPTCDTCLASSDRDWINAISDHHLLSLDTNPALVYALQPPNPTELATARPPPAGVEAKPSEDDAPATTKGNGQPERSAQPEENQRTREKEGVDRDRGRSFTTSVFLDSGCLSGSYIKEELAKKLASHKPSYFIPQVTRVCGAFGGCELSTRKLLVHIALTCQTVTKQFELELKVVKNLPYDIMIGRADMLKNNIQLSDTLNTPTPKGEVVTYILPMKDTPLELDFRNSDGPIRPKVTGQRHVTWADLHEHPANTPSMTEVIEQVHDKRSGVAPANLEGRSDQALISTSTSTQVE